MFPVPSYLQKQCKATVKVSQGQEAPVHICYLPRQLAPPHTAIYCSTPVLSTHLVVTVIETAWSTYLTACHAMRTSILQYTCTGHSPWSHGHRGRSPGPCLVSSQTACSATCSQRSCSGHTHSTLNIYPLHHQMKRNSILQSVYFCNVQSNVFLMLVLMTFRPCQMCGGHAGGVVPCFFPVLS